MSKRLSGPLSPNEIEDRFEEAARTLRRLPDDMGATCACYHPFEE